MSTTRCRGAAARAELRGASTPKSDTANVPAAPVNALLYALTAVESRVLPYLPSPFGVSLLCVARKPSR
ncbi:MAG: hypothetical protein R3F49_06595 [Planctomycetota bacterium]